MRRAWLLILFAALTAGFAAGCGGGRDRGRNSDLDRPKPTDRR